MNNDQNFTAVIHRFDEKHERLREFTRSQAHSLANTQLELDELREKFLIASNLNEKLFKGSANTYPIQIRPAVREFFDQIERRSLDFFSFFDVVRYYALYEDVRSAGIDPLDHYFRFGAMEFREPVEGFNVESYFQTFPELKSGERNPILHYMEHFPEAKSLVWPIRNSLLNTDPSNTALALAAISKSSSYWSKNLDVITILNNERGGNGTLSQKAFNSITGLGRTIDLPTISVVMPTWNRQRSIGKAIESVLNQSLLPTEIIVADDGSTDATVATIRDEWSEAIDTGLIRILELNHQGVSAARNAGLEVAVGEVITYLDSDNTWNSDYLLLIATAFGEDDTLMTVYANLEGVDLGTDERFSRCEVYDRSSILASNSIDLNVFAHRRSLYSVFGGFDTRLDRLVDWDLILRYTDLNEPAHLPYVGVNYLLDKGNLENITHTVDIGPNKQKIRSKFFADRVRLELETLKIAYVLWDFPALSQTFVMNELRYLVERGFDVKVYYKVEADKSANLDFEVESYLVEDHIHLSRLLSEHDRNYCHSHFVYPTVTLLTWPACEANDIHFTFFPHAVDLFHENNVGRNRIGQICQSDLCDRVFVYGEHHKDFLIKNKVPENKIFFNFQAVNLEDHSLTTGKRKRTGKKSKIVGLTIARFIEKKGIEYLIEAASRLPSEKFQFNIYGYGPLQEDYENKIKELGVENVRLLGPLEGRGALANAYDQCDFLLAPCVIARNGDRDGFPTVILEAMAAEKPVITTAVSAIPDYLEHRHNVFLARPADTDSLVDVIDEFSKTPADQLNALKYRASQLVQNLVGVENTVSNYMDVWAGYRIDIVLVTYNTAQYDDHEETFEIIQRIIDHTTTRFNLIVVDNGSDSSFVETVSHMLRQVAHANLIVKSENVFCGPASNIAFECSNAEFAIYVCSKEGFVARHGWERCLISAMRNNPDAIMGGHLCHQPRFVYGHEIVHHPEFAKFRNPEFAQNNPDRVFRHVQGGVYVYRKGLLDGLPLFNPLIPHNNMDVEASYFVESMGYELLEIPEVASITTKTLPRLDTIIDQQTVIAHPLTARNVDSVLDDLVGSDKSACNICGWRGASFVREVSQNNRIHIRNRVQEIFCRVSGYLGFAEGQGLSNSVDASSNMDFVCPECGSTKFGRKIFRVLANSWNAHRGEKAGFLVNDQSLINVLTDRMFAKAIATCDADVFKGDLEKLPDALAEAVIDLRLIANHKRVAILSLTLEKLRIGGSLTINNSYFAETGRNIELATSSNRLLKKISTKSSGKYSLTYYDPSCQARQYDWQNCCKITRVG